MPPNPNLFDENNPHNNLLSTYLSSSSRISNSSNLSLINHPTVLYTSTLFGTSTSQLPSPYLSLLLQSPKYRQHGILFSKSRGTLNSSNSWRSPTKNSRNSTSFTPSSSSTEKSNSSNIQSGRTPGRNNSNLFDSPQPILLHIHRARSVCTTLTSNSAIIVTASIYVPVFPTSTTSNSTVNNNTSISEIETNILHQVIMPLRGITSRVARTITSPPLLESTNISPESSSSSPISILQPILQVLQTQGTWQRLTSTHTPPIDAIPSSVSNNNNNGNSVLLNDLVWDFKLPLLLPSLSSIIILELSDRTQTLAHAGGNQGNIGTVIILPEWFPNIQTNQHNRNSINPHHPTSTLRSTGVLTVPNPGWHSIITNNSSSISSSGSTNFVPELLLRIDTPSSSINTNTAAINYSIPNRNSVSSTSTGTTATSTNVSTTASTAITNISSSPSISYITNFSSPVTLVIQPHHHTIYCDRKRAVCTASGALREGNILAIASIHPHYKNFDFTNILPSVITSTTSTITSIGRTSPEKIHKDIRCTWYHNDLQSHIPQENDILFDEKTEGELGDDTFIHPISFYDKVNQLRFIRISNRSLSDIFTPPPIPGLIIPNDDDPLLAYQTIVQAITASDAAQHTDSPLYSSVAASRMLRNGAAAALTDCTQFPLTLTDVGRIITAIITIPNLGTFRIQHQLINKISNNNHTIEPAPPRIREIWIEGEAKVGSTLQARTVYYGGLPGPCEYSWIRVDNDGNRTETEPKISDPFAPYPLPHTPAALLDPRCYLITEKDIGCCFKIQCDPVRTDGIRGAPTTSKPTPDITE